MEKKLVRGSEVFGKQFWKIQGRVRPGWQRVGKIWKLPRGGAHRNEGKNLETKQRKHVVTPRYLVSDAWNAGHCIRLIFRASFTCSFTQMILITSYLICDWCWWEKWEVEVPTPDILNIIAFCMETSQWSNASAFFMRSMRFAGCHRILSI